MTFSSLRARRTFKTVAKRKISRCENPFATSCASDARNCGNMMFLYGSRTPLQRSVPFEILECTPLWQDAPFDFAGRTPSSFRARTLKAEVNGNFLPGIGRMNVAFATKISQIWQPRKFVAGKWRWPWSRWAPGSIPSSVLRCLA